MLAQAEEFERRAQAYRLVAMNMNGARVDTKKSKSILDGAIELRQSQKRMPKPRKKKYQGTAATIADRKAFLRQQLAQDGPLSTNELTARVIKHEGFELSRDRIYQNLREMPELQLRGERANAKWHVKAKSVKRTKVATKHAAKKVAKVAKVAKKTAKKTAAKAAKRKASPKLPGEKGRVIAEVLQERGPLTVKDLTAAVRERGIDGLTGIHNYVKQGVISRRGKTPRTWVYAAKSLPPVATASELAATVNEAPTEAASAS